MITRRQFSSTVSFPTTRTVAAATTGACALGGPPRAAGSAGLLKRTATCHIKHALMPPLQGIANFNGQFFYEAERYYLNPFNVLTQLEKIPQDWTIFRRKQNTFFLLKNINSINNSNGEGGMGENGEQQSQSGDMNTNDVTSRHFTGNRVVGLLQSMLCMPTPRFFPPEGMKVEEYRKFIASPENQGTMILVTRDDSVGIAVIGPDGNPRLPVRSWLQTKNTKISGSQIKLSVNAEYFSEIFAWIDENRAVIDSCQSWYIRAFSGEMWERLKRAKHYREQAQEDIDNPKPPIVVESTGVDMGRPTYHFKRKGREYAFDDEEYGNNRSVFFSDPKWLYLSERSGQLRENDVSYGSANPLDINMHNAIGCCRKGHFSTTITL